MTSRKKRLGFALVAVAVVAGCASTPPTRLTEHDDGRRVVVAVGDSLEVALPGNPTTGYAWHVEDLAPAVAVQEGAATYTRDSGALGAGGVYVWHFTAVAAGTAPLRLTYARAWEPAPPEREFQVTLVVR